MQTEKQKALTLKLANFIESKKYEFNMSTGYAMPRCGTAGCIGGHAAVLWPSLRDYIGVSSGNYSWNYHKLAEKLGITCQQHDQLFVPRNRNGGRIYLMDVTRSMAVAALRRLAKTGSFYFSKNYKS